MRRSRNRRSRPERSAWAGGAQFGQNEFVEALRTEIGERLFVDEERRRATHPKRARVRDVLAQGPINMLAVHRPTRGVYIETLSLRGLPRESDLRRAMGRPARLLAE